MCEPTDDDLIKAWWDGYHTALSAVVAGVREIQTDPRVPDGRILAGLRKVVPIPAPGNPEGKE